MTDIRWNEQTRGEEGGGGEKEVGRGTDGERRRGK